MDYQIRPKGSHPRAVSLDIAGGHFDLPTGFEVGTYWYTGTLTSPASQHNPELDSEQASYAVINTEGDSVVHNALLNVPI